VLGVSGQPEEPALPFDAVERHIPLDGTPHVRHLALDIKASIRLATAFFQPGNAAMYAFTAASPSGLAERTGVRGRAVLLRTGVLGFGFVMP